MFGKYQISLMLAGVFGLMVMLSSCFKDPQSPGYEYMPDMYRTAAYKTYTVNPNFKDSSNALLPAEGTISRGEWPYEASEVRDFPFPYPNTKEGYEAAGAQARNPLPVSDKVLDEGQVLYTNFCSHCHGTTGNGDGTIVNNDKFPAPPSYSTGMSSRGGAMKDLTAGKIFHTITYGVNMMGSHASQLDKEQRWKIVYYVQTLQGKTPEELKGQVQTETPGDGEAGDSSEEKKGGLFQNMFKGKEK